METVTDYGYEPNADDPYTDVCRDELPAWWKRAIEEYDTAGLSTYRPPVFDDMILKSEVVKILENRYDIEIDFVCLSMDDPHEWSVRINQTTVGTISRHRSKNNYSVFEMDAEAFYRWIENMLINDTEINLIY